MAKQNKVLIIFAHPALQNSRVNIELINAVRQMKGVTFHDLYERYPDFYIQAEEEQALLEKHDIIILQFPFMWYSVPSIFRQWQDITLKHGWAYGSQGTALKGKKFLCAISTGGGPAAYESGTPNRYSLPQLLAPIRQSARLCSMTYLPPFVIHGTHMLSGDEIRNWAEQYHKLIGALRDDTIDYSKIENSDYINSGSDLILGI